MAASAENEMKNNHRRQRFSIAKALCLSNLMAASASRGVSGEINKRLAASAASRVCLHACAVVTVDTRRSVSSNETLSK